MMAPSRSTCSRMVPSVDDPARRASILLQPRLGKLNDFFVRNQLAGVGLGEAMLNGQHEGETLDRIIDCRVFRQVLGAPS